MSLILFTVGLLAPSILNVLNPGRVFAANEQTSSYTTGSSFATGSFNNTAVAGNEVSLCNGIGGCDQYVRPVTINNTGSQVDSAEVEISLNTQALIGAGKMQSNCGDIRFMDSDDATQLTSGSIANCDTTNTTITVIVPIVPANTTKTIYMYYGSLTGGMQPLNGAQRNNLNSAVNSDPAPPATLTGNAFWDSTNNDVQLTSNANGQSGTLEYKDNAGSNYSFSTQFWDGGGTGADSVFLFMGANATPGSENDAVGGYIFAYDEYQHYIGIQYNGSLLAAVYCSSASSITEISTSGAQLSQNSAACNINDSTWSTAEIIQSSNEIQMQLNGQTVITYNSANLPVATGPLMGWGARSGGSTDYHLIRDVNLTESGDDVFTPSQTTVGAEGPASGTLNTSGNWMSPAINVGSGAVLGNGVSSSAALTANLADIGTGTSDSVEVGIQTGNSAAAAESASTQWLGTYTHANNGALTLTSANLTGAGVNITNNSNMYAVLVFSLSESSGVSPEVSNVVFSYTPGYYAPPSAPQNFTSTGDYSSGATLSWAAPANNNGSAIQHYSIYYSTDGGTTWNLITTTASTTYTINEGTLLYPGTGYEFKVTATNGNGEGPGATADLTTSAAPVTQISSCTQLQNINTENPFGTYELVQNIDCSGTNTWNGGAGFVPIGTDSSLGYFEGTFNGEGYTISNLYIHQPTGCDVGLFYRTLAATIADVTLSSPQISGECNVGSVAGATYGGSVSYASTTNGTVTGAASGSGIGGLIGDSDYNSNTQVPGTVETSSYTGTVAGGSSSQVGGLIGDVGTIMATNDYANGTVSGHNDVGGLIGLSATSETGVATDITDSYAAGSVTASEQYAGGLVGFDNDILVDNSFAAAAVTGGSGSYAGGLSGYDTASPAWSGNYYDQSTATQSACVGYSDSSNACLAVNTSGSPNSTYFFNNHTSAPLNQWNFNTIWSTQATSYPVLTADVTMHSTKPVIVLYGANPLYITEGGILVDPGAYVTDSDNTVQMHQIVSTNDVNTSVPGTYAITYNVSDNFGNAALPVTRTVIVPTPPSAQSSASATATPASAIASMPQDTSATTQATTDSSGQIYLDPFTDFTDGSGYEITGIVGQEYTFTATNDNGQTSTHTLTISSINDANSNYPTVTLTLHSTPQTFTMSSGQTVQKDVTGDSRPDIGITVDDITASNVALTVWDIQRTSVPKEQIALSSSDKQNDTWWWVVGAVVVMAFLVILYRRRERKDSAND